MKKCMVLFLLFIFAALTDVNAQTYGLDNTNPSVFTKFRVPDTDLRALWFNTNLSFNSNRNDNSSDYGNAFNRPYSNTFSKSTDFRYSLNPYYRILSESESHYINLNASLSGAYDYYFYEYEPYYQSFSNTTKENNYNMNLNADFKYNNYINNKDFFYSGGANVNVSMNDTKTDNSSNSPRKFYQGTKTQIYSFSIGAGWGKFRNVTPVVSAIRFQERLKQLNMLNNNLSDKTIEDLARQFYKQPYYSQVFDRPGKYFWQGIDKTLSADGIDLNGLNMYAANYLMESVNEVRFIRQEGIMTGINLQFNYTNNYYSNNSVPITEQFYSLAEVYLQYSTQLNLNSQISFNISLDGGPNLIASPVIRQKYDINTGVAYNYELTDRLVTSASETINIAFYNSAIQMKHLVNTFSMSLRYFIEDNLSLNSNYTWSYTNDKYYNNMYINSNKVHSFNVGFTYYIERGFLF